MNVNYRPPQGPGFGGMPPPMGMAPPMGAGPPMGGGPPMGAGPPMGGGPPMGAGPPMGGMPGFRPAGMPPPGMAPGPPPNAPPGALADQFRGMSMNQPPAPGMGFGPPPPLGLPPTTIPAPGFRPGINPPSVPSTGVPINLPSMGPPSATSAAQAGIPPPGMPYSRPPGMAPPPPGGNAPWYGPPPGGPPGASAFPPPPVGGGSYLGGPGGVPPPVVPPVSGSGPPGQASPPSRAGGQNRIDPTQIPRPAAPVTAEVSIYDTRVTGQHLNPPPAASRFIVRDRGSAGPRYMRSTLNQVPNTSDVLHNSAMPFAVIVSPLALPDPADDPLPVVDFGEVGPVRCSRCKAYVNPYVRWIASGRTFICNFCNFANPTPNGYYCHLGPDGRRSDVDERPELCKGSVEIAATAEYSVRPCMAPTHLFLIDTSASAVATGATASACAAVSSALDVVQGGERARVALATFDTSIHFYSVSGGTPRMLVVSDINDVYAPTSAPLLMPLASCKAELQALLKTIPTMFQHQSLVESCALSAIEAGIEVLKESGGKIHTFLAVLPTIGTHALKSREGGDPKGGDKVNVLAPLSQALKTVAVNAADFMVCIDISLLGQGYMDVASLAELVRTTGGSLYTYTPFLTQLDHEQLVNDLRWNVSRIQGLEAIMRVRCSSGLDIESYTGHLYHRPGNTTDVDFPALDCDKAVVAKVVHVEKLAAGSEVYLQAALLYTTMSGHRRIRIHTLALPVSDNISTIFKGADLDAQVTAVARRVAVSLPTSPVATARELITTATVNILYAYRRYCATNSSAVQLILPEALKLLPLYALALLKSPALRDNVRPDDRMVWSTRMMCLPACHVMPLLYPRLFSITRLLESAEPLTNLPAGLVLSAEAIESGGAYLLENGTECLLYFEKGVVPALMEDLIGVPNYEELNRLPVTVPLLARDNGASKLVQDLLVKVRVQRCNFLRTRVVRKSDPHESHFFNLLVEDRSAAGMSYVEYLCQVHRQIQNKMS